MQQVIIAEKPSVAREIARVLRICDKKDGYITDGKTAVTWAFGHLIQLAQPQDYEHFSIPFRPDIFKLKINTVKNDKGQWQVDKGAEKQLAVIDHLFSSCSEIVVATDAGREGELIFRYIYQYLGCTKPFRRLWVSSLTEKAISEGFKKLQPGGNYDNLFQSAKCRSEADWLVGFNASIALSQALQRKLRVSLGRVQTPTLAMIVERYLHNKNFVAEPYYTVRITCAKKEQRFTADSDNFFNKQTAEDILSVVQNADTACISDIEQKEKKEQPPLLFDLTSLQRKANQKFSFSAANTLQLAQTLYENGYITYPRTDSAYISKDVFETVPGILHNIERHPQYGSFAKELSNLNTRPVNDNKISDHHAILPTDKYPAELNKEQQKIYGLVVKRTIEAFSQACIKDTVSVLLNCAENTFKASGSTVKIPGWRLIDITLKESNNEEENNEDTQLFPAMLKFENVSKEKTELLTKATKPKPLHTEATLLASMETCGKDAEDDVIRDAMKDSGIGTPATRANIIEKLLNIGYTCRERKSLVPTPKGIAVYELVKNQAIASPELTGHWESRLNRISKGNENAGQFVNDIFLYAEDITKNLLNIAPALLKQNLNDNNKSALLCPKCREGELRESEKNFYCSNYKKSDCNFVIWKNVSGKKINAAQIKQLVEKKRTNLISGFKSKAGKEFQAKLKFDDNMKVIFEFEK